MESDIINDMIYRAKYGVPYNSDIGKAIRTGEINPESREKLQIIFRTAVLRYYQRGVRNEFTL